MTRSPHRFTTPALILLAAITCCPSVKAEHAVFLASATNSATVGNKPNSSDGSKADSSLAKQLRKLRIDSVDFKETPMEDALEVLRAAAAKADLPINFIYEKDPAQKNSNKQIAQVVTTQPIPAAIISELRLENVTGEDLLNLMCRQTDCEMRMEGDTVSIFRHEFAKWRMVRRRWTVDPKFFQDSDSDFPSNKHHVQPDARSALMDMGVRFRKEATANYDPNTRILTVYNTEDELDSVAEAIMLFCKNSGKAYKGPQPHSSDTPDKSDSEVQKRLTKKLKKIHISTVSFDEATIEQVLDFLRNEAGKASQPINFVFEKPQTLTADSIPHNDAHPPVIRKLVLSDVTAADLLNRINKMTDCTILMKHNTVIISAIHPLTRRQWTVPPAFFASVSSFSNGKEDVKGDFIDMGISFPAGASATYSPTTHILTVCNTEEQLNFIAELLWLPESRKNNTPRKKPAHKPRQKR